MADNFQVTQGSGTTIATDQAAGGEHYQKIKLVDPTTDSIVGIGVPTNPMSFKAADTTGSGTITALNGVLAAVTANMGNIAFQITGTSTATVTFEASLNGTDWNVVNLYSPTQLVTGTATNGNGLFTIPCGTYQQVRARAS